MEIVFICFFIGLLAATIGSILGLGGGIIIVPALLTWSPFLFHQPLTVAQAVGSSLAVVVVTAFSSLWKFLKQKRVDVRGGLLYLITIAPATILGSMVTSSLHEGIFYLLFGIFLMLMTVFISFGPSRQLPADQQLTLLVNSNQKNGLFRSRYFKFHALWIGVGIGLISGLFGVGGGSLLVPMLILLFRYPPHLATATSMLVVFFSATIGASTKIYLGEIHWLSVVALAPGALVGGWLGAWITGRINSKWLMYVLMVGFGILAIRFIFYGWELL